MPLYANAETYRSRRASGSASQVIAYWTSARVTYYTSRALNGWFHESFADSRSLLDLNHLAHALYAGGFDEGAEVFEAIGPFITPGPWKDVAERQSWWQDDFLRARRHYLREPKDRATRTQPRR